MITDKQLEAAVGAFNRTMLNDYTDSLANAVRAALEAAEAAGYAKALKDTNYQEPAPSAPAADERQARINAAIVEHERIGAGHELNQDAYFARVLAAADAARAQSAAPVSAALCGYIDPSAEYAGAAFSFQPYGVKTTPVYLAPVSAQAGEAFAYQARFWTELYGKYQWSKWQSCTREQHEAVQRGEPLYNLKAESLALYTTPQPATPSSAERPSSAEYVLRMLVAAGHVTQAKVDEARGIAAGLVPGSTEQPGKTLADYCAVVAAHLGGELPGDAWHVYRREGLTPAQAAAKHRELVARHEAPGAPEADERTFDEVFRSTECQRAGLDHGWRGIAEFAWNAARAQSSAAASVSAANPDAVIFLDRDGCCAARVLSSLSVGTKLYAAPSVAPVSARDGEAATYSSTQSTACAGCGKVKHTPLRVDAMGGYVCLTCIDKKLATPPADVRRECGCQNVTARECIGGDPCEACDCDCHTFVPPADARDGEDAR